MTAETKINSDELPAIRGRQFNPETCLGIQVLVLRVEHQSRSVRADDVCAVAAKHVEGEDRAVLQCDNRCVTIGQRDAAAGCPDQFGTVTSTSLAQTFL
jgi:hypothetical protein